MVNHQAPAIGELVSSTRQAQHGLRSKHRRQRRFARKILQIGGGYIVDDIEHDPFDEKFRRGIPFKLGEKLSPRPQGETTPRVLVLLKVALRLQSPAAVEAARGFRREKEACGKYRRRDSERRHSETRCVHSRSSIVSSIRVIMRSARSPSRGCNA